MIFFLWFLWWFFSLFFFFLFCSLNTICLSDLCGVLWSSWICGLVFVFNLESFQPLVLQIFLSFLSLFLLLLVFPLCVCYALRNYSTVLCMFSSGFYVLFSLCNSVLEFSVDILQAHWLFPWPHPVRFKPIKGIFYSCYNVFDFKHSLLILFWSFHLSAYITMYSCIFSTYSFCAPDISIIVVLNSQSDNYNICNVSESGYDAWSVFLNCVFVL